MRGRRRQQGQPYAGLGDKAQLYRLALQAYVKQVGEGMVAMLDEPGLSLTQALALAGQAALLAARFERAGREGEWSGSVPAAAVAGLTGLTGRDATQGLAG